MKKRIVSTILLLTIAHLYTVAQTTYYSTSTANQWSLSSGGASCGCSPTTADFVVIEHNWANGAFYPLTHPANIAFGNFLSVNPLKVTVKNGGVCYQQPTLTTGTEIYVESGGFWGYNGSLNLDLVVANSAKVMANAGTILVNGSYNNDIAITGGGIFCKNGSWVNDASGSLRGITDANMDSYFTDDAYGCTDCCINASTLPVELTSFTIEKIDNAVYVNWTTASEINNDYFEVQVSADGISWNTIAKITGAGSTNNVSDYAYVDHDLTGFDVKYYRLKQVDFDGTTTYSNTKWVQLKAKDGDFEVYQNENEISVMLNYKSPVVKINLLNVSGQEIEQQLQGVIITNNSYTFAKSNLATGVYFIQVISKNQVLSKKIVVQ
jgi:hypothetical protein